jgi:hypothetical protein
MEPPAIPFLRRGFAATSGVASFVRAKLLAATMWRVDGTPSSGALGFVAAEDPFHARGTAGIEVVSVVCSREQGKNGREEASRYFSLPLNG